MRHLVIGVPARDEAETIVALADALEAAAVLLGETTTVELVLAYQDSIDDTLERFVSRRSRFPQRVLRCPPATAGKGRNVKLLIEHAAASGADLLLVDGDMRNCAPVDLARFVATGHERGSDLVLPLWCRPWGHANVTNYLAAPLLHALSGARVRQPLAGQRLISHLWGSRLRAMPLPDDYGIDVALTIAVLDGGGKVDQVVVPQVDHDDRQVNGAAIMLEVAQEMLTRIAAGPLRDRSDVAAPDDHVAELTWPQDDHVATGTPAAPEAARDAWLLALAAAVRASRSGADPARLAAELRDPFFDHADGRRRGPRPALAADEAYVWELGAEIAARLP